MQLDAKQKPSSETVHFICFFFNCSQTKTSFCIQKKKKENEFCLLLPYFISFSTDGKNRLKKLGSAAYGSEAQNKNVHESHGPQKLKSQFMSQHVTYTVGHIFPTMMDNISIINNSWTSMIHYTSRGSNINIRIE